MVGTLVPLDYLTGFDFNKHSIPPEEIRGGGLPKDGIPAILEPHFIPATEATFLSQELFMSEPKARRMVEWDEA